MSWVKRNPKIKYSNKDDIVTKLLKIRGIEDRENFLNPKISSLHSPYLLKNIEYVKDRIIEAIKNGSKIAISLDSDADGITSGATMVRYLKQFTQNIQILYHQRDLGHGIENQLNLIEDNINLVIILDSSSNSTEACKTLHEKGIEVLIIDHHEIEKHNPYATIVNPQMPDCNYPNKGISGVGLTYKVIQVIDDTIGSGTADDYIDLVAVGMMADMMPMNVMENRYIVGQGLKNINNKGLLAILNQNNVDLSSVNSQTIGFTIAPLINGVARMSRIELAIDLLLEDDFEKCCEIVAEMKIVNKEKKKIEKELYKIIVTKINPDDKILTGIHEVGSKSFNGLIANKIAEEFRRPVLVLREYEGSLMGSYRSYGNFSMKDFLHQKDIQRHIEFAVGHGGAGGIEIKANKLQKFKDAINKKLTNTEFKTELVYDMEFDVKEITTKMIREIEKFNYLTGTDFPVAKFLVKNMCISTDNKGRSVVVMGEDNDTVKIMTDDVKVIKFRTDSTWAEELGMLDYIDVIGQLTVNEWFNNWKKELVITNQLMADEYRLSD
jgi:single-stranded-DNA-specific exonuclease